MDDNLDEKAVKETLKRLLTIVTLFRIRLNLSNSIGLKQSRG